MKLLRWLFSDFKLEIIVKVEPKIFPTEKAFQFKQNFNKKSENPFIPIITTTLQ
jgi:hypothetical protein